MSNRTGNATWPSQSWRYHLKLSHRSSNCGLIFVILLTRRSITAVSSNWTNHLSGVLCLKLWNPISIHTGSQTELFRYGNKDHLFQSISNHWEAHKETLSMYGKPGERLAISSVTLLRSWHVCMQFMIFMLRFPFVKEVCLHGTCISPRLSIRQCNINFLFFCLQQWVAWHRGNRLLRGVDTNNGLEGINSRFKRRHLPSKRPPSLSMLVRILVTLFLPNEFRRYVLADVCPLTPFNLINVCQLIYNQQK